MPEISRFLGIVIGMFYKEHGVPHFHAVYGEHDWQNARDGKPLVAIEPLE